MATRVAGPFGPREQGASEPVARRNGEIWRGNPKIDLAWLGFAVIKRSRNEI
jgi:hypothetical protein